MSPNQMKDQKQINTSPFEIAQKQCDSCAEFLNLDPNIHAIIRVPKREIHVSIPVRMDNGAIKIFQGFRVVHNDVLGPAKGGIRFHPDETIDTVRALATWMTWKSSLLNLPLGGAKGGVICNPKELSMGVGTEQVYFFLWQFVGQVDVPARMSIQTLRLWPG